MNTSIACAFIGDSEPVSFPQHGGRGIGHHVAADVHWIPLPGVEDSVINLILRGVVKRKCL